MKTNVNAKNIIFFISIFLISLLSFSQDDDKKSEDEKSDSDKKEKKEKVYSDLINDKAITDSGLFDVHKIDDKYYYEINDSLLGRDMLMVTRIVNLSKEIPINRHKMSEQVLSWQRFNNNILFIFTI